MVDGFLVNPGAVHDAPADELDHRRRAPAAIGAPVAEAQVDPAVRSKVRVQRHIEDPADPVAQRAEPEGFSVAHRRPGYEFRLRTVGGDDGEAAHLLREQDAAVRQRGDGIGEGFEAIDHLGQPVTVALGGDDPLRQLEGRRHPEVCERRVGALLGDEDGQAADLGFAEGLRPGGHAEIRRTLGDALRDGLHALAPDQRRADKRVALGRTFEAGAVADGAVPLVEAFERLGPPLARHANGGQADERNDEDGKRHIRFPRPDALTFARLPSRRQPPLARAGDPCGRPDPCYRSVEKCTAWSRRLGRGQAQPPRACHRSSGFPGVRAFPALGRSGSRDGQHSRESRSAWLPLRGIAYPPEFARVRTHENPAAVFRIDGEAVEVRL